MIRRMTLIVLLAYVAMFAFGLPASAAQRTITVNAAASLREAFEAAAPEFTKNTSIAVTFNFGGSDALSAQIAQGAPVDVFASANEAQMQKLASAGLLLAPAAIFARNRLVVVAPNVPGNTIESLRDLATPGTRVVLAAPSVPVGDYARRAFAKVAGHNGFAADFAAAVEKNVVSNEIDVKAVVTKIALDEGDAGIVYATDVTPALADKVKVVPLPADAAVEAKYPIAAVRASHDPDAARAFVAFVLGPQGQAALRERRFLGP
jgi:molybdate transport system substrate-binding protein